MDEHDSSDTHEPAGASPFRPVFIVGASRSGTTLLAVLLDRHPQVVVPPETQFFNEFVPRHWHEASRDGRDGSVRAALAFPRIADLDLGFEDVLGRYQAYEATPAGLLRALMEGYAARRGASRQGEKTPGHLEHVVTLLAAYPHAKVVAIVRDGRDVVRSLLATSWAQGHNPRRFWLFCLHWSDAARRVLDLVRRFGPERFRFLTYEALLENPEPELRRVCEFIGEEFDPCQLDLSKTTQAVPTWEADWKQKAHGKLDPRRAGAWRREASPEQIWAMNAMMGPELRSMGYQDTGLTGCPGGLRLKLGLLRTLRWPLARRASRLALKTLRLLRVETSRSG